MRVWFLDSELLTCFMVRSKLQKFSLHYEQPQQITEVYSLKIMSFLVEQFIKTC